MTIKEVLIEARKKITAPQAWKKGAFAMSATGKGLIASDPNAVCWCLAGAIDAAAKTINVDGKGFYDSLWTVAKAIQRSIPLESAEAVIVTWNDNQNRKHEEVLALLDKTIADQG